MRGDVLALAAVSALAAAGVMRRGARAVLIPSEAKGLQEVLGILRAMEQSYHATHWLASGKSAYGDHLLFERLYAAGGDPDIVKQIDGLGERLVAYVGPMAVEGEALSDCTERATKRFNLLVKRSGGSSSPDARVHAALEMEKELQEVLSSTYASLKASDVLSLGLDDFLMALADERDTAIYLLQQRLGGSQAKPLGSSNAKGTLKDWPRWPLTRLKEERKRFEARMAEPWAVQDVALDACAEKVLFDLERWLLESASEVSSAWMRKWESGQIDAEVRDFLSGGTSGSRCGCGSRDCGCGRRR